MRLFHFLYLHIGIFTLKLDGLLSLFIDYLVRLQSIAFFWQRCGVSNLRIKEEGNIAVGINFIMVIRDDKIGIRINIGRLLRCLQLLKRNSWLSLGPIHSFGSYLCKIDTKYFRLMFDGTCVKSWVWRKLSAEMHQNNLTGFLSIIRKQIALNKLLNSWVTFCLKLYYLILSAQPSHTNQYTLSLHLHQVYQV